MKRNRKKIRYGFTLVELLTTLAVIGVLLALLVPALNQVQKTALNVKQKAQFHAIGTALEAFRNDYGDYPRSAYSAGGGFVYSGSQMLAEALVGRDGLGFNPDSFFLWSGWASGKPLYYPDLSTLTAPEIDENIKSRKGPYLELESANAVKLSSLYGTGNFGSLIDSYVLVDMYKQVTNLTTGKQTGMPILYYKANTMQVGHDPAATNYATNTYNIDDAYCNGDGLPIMPPPFQPSGPLHPMENSPAWFYEAIKNPDFPGDPAYPTSGQPPRPYRAESFILHSAGPDGWYGTSDDVFNFDTEK